MKSRPETSISCKAGALLAALSSAARIVEKRTTIPILALVAISHDGDALAVVRSTDLERDAANHFECTSVLSDGKAFSIMVNPHVVCGILKTLGKSETVVLSALVEAGRARLSSGNTSVEFVAAMGMTADTFPAISPIAPGAVRGSVSMSADDLMRALRSCLVSASVEQTRYYLNGVLLQQIDGMIALTATDGHVLTQVKIKKTGDNIGNGQWIIPTKTGHEIVAMICDAGASGKVAIDVSDKVLSITLDGSKSTLISKLIDGTYPDYNRIIPQLGAQGSCTVRVKCADVVNITRRAIAVSSERGRAMKLTYGNKKGLTIEVHNPEGGKLRDFLPCEPEIGASSGSVGFNAKLFSNSVRSFGGADVSLQFSDPGSAMLMTSAKAKLSTLQVIMPMRVYLIALGWV